MKLWENTINDFGSVAQQKKNQTEQIKLKFNMGIDWWDFKVGIWRIDFHEFLD